ncbi:hypothetical protein SETIT_9G140000v2 [Setaria italica]|uniref:Uncharacterized protein n=1 Tax=Setaria italica TaxID=4555 RepID=A0A368SGH8_SETIT|nr:tankyrase-1 isoform X2 [Setaria italica]RCV41488.1 hypothetical protein SETIT_9G140000v2 [Setaria italica]
MPSGRRRRGGGGGRGSFAGRGGGVQGGSGRGGGGGGGAGRGEYDQQRLSAEAISDIASGLGMECTINYGPDLQMSPQIKFLMACDSGNIRRIKALVESLDKDDRESLASARMEGLGALHAAAMKGKVEVCRYLVEVLKFDINSVSSPELGMTPLISAVSEGQVAAVRYLLDKGADPNKQDHEGYAPLHDAAKGGFDEIGRLLLTGGAIVDISSSEGTPLHAAAAFGKIGIMQILLEHHADVNKVSARGCTPLAETLLATPERLDESTRLKCLKLLVKAGADLNSRHPQTPLVIGTLKGLTECVECLLEAGADANIPAHDVGSKPIEIAAESGRRKLVEILFPFTSPIQAVPNWSIEGIIAHAKSINSKDKVNQGDNKDSKVDQKLHDEKAIKQDAASSKSYPEAINLDPKDAVLYSNRSFCHVKLGEAHEAFRDANTCIRLRPGWTKGYYRKGAALMYLKEYKQACDVFMAGIKLDPTNEEMEQAFWEAAEAMKKEHSAEKRVNSVD